MGAHIQYGVPNMKTTIDISDALLRDARKKAAKDGITVRALVERGLRHVLAETKPQKPFCLRRASFKGNGLRPELRDASWQAVRDLAYEDHGA